VDRASVSDFVRRRDWKRLVEDARRRRVDIVLVWKLDRGFRSSIECLRTLEDWQHRGVEFVCANQPEIDTGSPIGRLLLTVLAAVAEFERDLIRNASPRAWTTPAASGPAWAGLRHWIGPGSPSAGLRYARDSRKERSASAKRPDSWGSAPPRAAAALCD